MYAGRPPTSEEFTDINIFQPGNKELDGEVAESLISEEQAYRLAIALGGLKFSIEINKELGDAIGKAASGIAGFVSEVKDDIQAYKQESTPTEKGEPKGSSKA